MIRPIKVGPWIPKPVQVPLLNGKGGILMKDKATMSGDYLEKKER
jgi:hypothetical protein